MKEKLLILYWISIEKEKKNPGFLWRKTRDDIELEAEIGNVYFNRNRI